MHVPRVVCGRLLDHCSRTRITRPNHAEGARRMATRAVARRQNDGPSSVRTDSAEVTDRDLVGMYLDEIARTPLLDAAQEVELSRVIEAGVFAEQLLEEGATAADASEDELCALVRAG